MKRNSETLRTALFEQIAGLQDGSVKPETAKATAACAMAICKTVELDVKATEMFKSAGLEMKSLTLTSEELVKPDSPPVAFPDHLNSFDDGTIQKVLLGHKNGLSVEKIAERINIGTVDVELILEVNQAHG